MTHKNDLVTEEADPVLRAQAEQRLQTMNISGGSHDPQKLLHELQVHQIELEMQNEALRATQAELEAALTRSSNLFDFAPIPYLTTDAQGRICEANHAAARLFNQPCASLCSMGLPSFMKTEDLPVYQALVEKAAASGIRETGEITLSISGRRVWVLMNVVIEADKTSSLIALEDITERKEAEQQLALAANRYTDMLKANKDGFWLVDGSTGLIVDANEAAQMMLGYSRDELLSMRILDIDVVFDAEAYQQKIQQILADGWGVFETQHRTKDGRILDVEVSTLPEKSSRFLVAFIRDITQRRVMERELRKLSQAVEQTIESVVITDLNARIQYVNDAFLRNTGYQREEILGQNPRVLNSGKTPQATYDDLWDKLSHGQSWQGEFLNRRKDGSEYIEWASISPVHEADGLVSCYVAVKLDITERKQAEADLLAAKEAADSANAAKSQFLAHMSHELRTPLNAVLGFAQILEREGLPPDQQEMVIMIHEAGGSLLHIINDILDLSKLESGQVSLDVQPFCLSALLESTGQRYRPSAEAKGLTLRLENRAAHLGTLQGDSHRLEQVLANLIGNAIKFSSEGEITLTVFPLFMSETDTRLSFHVEDTGIGMDEATLTRLFQPFSQGDSSITRRFGGTGLGLLISKRLVEQMGGEMGVSSQSGQGSTFWFEVPFRRATEASPQDNHAAGVKPPNKPRLDGLRVLAVDDSLINLRMIERALILQGARVTLASDGREALEKLRDQPNGFDLVLMDIQMPVMDGISSTREIRRDPELAHLPVIALTAGVLPEEREAALNAGMNDFLAKPLNLEQMQNVLSRYVRHL